MIPELKKRAAQSEKILIINIGPDRWKQFFATVHKFL